MTIPGPANRPEAVERARDYAPFLRHAMAARPDIVEAFLARGAQVAAAQAIQSGAETVEAELRRRRRALSLAIALDRKSVV